MVSDTPNLSSILFEAKLLRRQADGLLLRLLENRESIEQRIHEAGRCDPLKSITGRSAMDNVIDDMREMISHADRLMGDANGAHDTGRPPLRTDADILPIAVHT